MSDQSDPYYPNYAYVGPPAQYNGTGATGGNSGTISLFSSQDLILESKRDA